jgi:2-keto-4-pentenoate hydratase/2-oxohepta-3-ene-1,7-dioic acid hydratase in catechol pathway
MRLGDVGAEVPAVEDAGSTFDLRPLTVDLDPEFFSGGGIRRVRAALDAGTLPELVGAPSLRRGAPVARPAAVICVGQNYAAHAAESGAQPPTTPIIFHKHPNTVVGPDDDVLVPPGATKVDWEVELAVVIGSRARYLPDRESAAAHIAGFTVSNDVSERTYQLEESGGQWSKGKSCETFNPLGPWLVTPDDVEPGDLRLQSWVNGEPRQESSTADMIFDVHHLIWHLSHYLVLEPGDVINTGTPQGVALSGRFPYLRAGDVMDLEIQGLGHQRQTLRDAVV